MNDQSLITKCFAFQNVTAQGDVFHGHFGKGRWSSESEDSPNLITLIDDQIVDERAEAKSGRTFGQGAHLATDSCKSVAPRQFRKRLCERSVRIVVQIDLKLRARLLILRQRCDRVVAIQQPTRGTTSAARVPAMPSLEYLYSLIGLCL